MTDQFVVGFKTQKWWGTLAAIDFFLGGTGSGTFILSMYFGFVPGMVLGWIAVALGAGALLVDLGRPGRFIRAGSQVGRSWISRGVLFTSFFLLFGLLRIVPELVRGLPWGSNTGTGMAISVLALVAGLGVMMYTGFLLSHSPAIPFWNTTMLPLLFAVSSFTSGAGLLLVLLPSLGPSSLDVRPLVMIGILLLIASLVFVWAYLLTMSSSTLAARESVHLLLRGPMARPFLIGVSLAGLVVPLVLTTISYLAFAGPGAAAPVLAVAGILVLAGGYLFRHSVLGVGVYPPVIDL